MVPEFVLNELECDNNIRLNYSLLQYTFYVSMCNLDTNVYYISLSDIT